MSQYKNVKQTNNIKVYKENKKQTNIIVSKKKLHIVGLFFICMVTSLMFGFSLSNLKISNEVKNITSSWAPNIADLGKIKFVNQSESEIDAYSIVDSMQMPFINSFILSHQDDAFLVSGLGGLIVKACLDGKVTKIIYGEQKTIYVSHGKGLVSVYGNIDNLGVKEGDKVNKNSALGVSFDSVINFKILFRNKAISGLTVKNGEMVFE